MANYRHDWEIGTKGPSVDAIKAMAILQSRPNDIFPFEVKGRNGEMEIKLGSTYDLMGTFGPKNWGSGSDPVQVIRVNKTSFTFLTLADHHRGEGQTISFETYENRLNVGPMEIDSSNPTKIVWLSQYGTYVSSWRHPFVTSLNVAANLGAGGAWWLQAHNLRVALGTEDGTLDKVLSGPRDVFYHF